MHTGDDCVRTQGDSGRMQPSGEISGETRPTNAVILDLQPPGGWKNTFQLFKPVCGILLLMKYTHQLINPVGKNLDNKIEEIPFR